MDGLTITTGVWPAAVLVSVIISAVATPLVLRAYRAATLRGMSQGMSQETSLGISRRSAVVQSTSQAAAEFQPPPIEVRELNDADLRGTNSQWREARRRVHRAQCAQAMAGSGYVLIMVASWMLISGDGFALSRFVFLSAIYAWPLLIALALVGAVGRGGWLGYIAIYGVIVTLTAGVTIAVNEAFTVTQAIYLWLFANLVPSVLFLGVLHQRIRAMGPLILAIAMAGTVFSFGLFAIASNSESVLHIMAGIGVALGLGTELVFVLMLLLPFLLGALMSVLLLRAIGFWYRTKRVSTNSITLGCLWLLFAVWQPITFAFENISMALAGPISFVAYVGLYRLGCRLWTAPPHSKPRSILLLRVFALETASRSLFALWSPSWLRLGSIAMISGPDLATTAVEPNEFLAFIGGRLEREFIGNHEQIKQHLDGYDDQPDADGNFRTNDFFCHNHTWRPVVQQLATRADGVLMDLRGFRRGNDGCAWELSQLLERVDLNKVLLLTNKATDHDHLLDTLNTCWQSVSAKSPNVSGTQAVLRTLPMSSLNATTASRLIQATMGAYS